MLAHVTVSGRVQGVGFRYSAQQKAVQNNLKGWVQNKADGNVELKVEGPGHQIDRFLEELEAGFHQFIKVNRMDVNKFDKEEGYTNFSIK